MSSAPVIGSDPAPAPAVSRPVTVALVFPPGTLTLLQSRLRTQADVREQDLSPADLAKLLVTIDGTGEKVLNQVTISGQIGDAIRPTTHTHRLMRISGTPGVAATCDSAQQATRVTQVPDGTYHLKVEVFAGARSTQEGGGQTSSKIDVIGGNTDGGTTATVVAYAP